ncbi:MFS transporter [Geobacillus subterraneus]|uniref:MFS transporter n=2 Tax=Geobacillus TaxID=129337 RepID=A0ABM6AE98_9BACL|nr:MULTISPECIES: MFS transporter [Geobacillus]AMX84674.1 MFS transporter [Geobacillus subterraneus]KZS24877.1 MFS transporter [Geobacillus subterraneus]OXB85494.1 MFS transporter [Geobacillus uzenensis]
MNWKRSVRVLWLCNFMVSAGMTMVIPFLSLFLWQMGVTEHHALSIWTGLVFSVTFLSAAVMAPIWGMFADKYGQRANLIRAGIGMGLITSCMAFAHSPMALLVLRFLVGFFSGFITVSFSYLARVVPKDHSGEALGTLQTGSIAGNVIGPLIGGALSDWFGFRPVFLVTGFCILATLLPVVFWLDKDPVAPQTQERHASFKEVFAHRPLVILFVATFLVQIAVLGVNSMMTIFVQSLVGDSRNLAFLSGLASSITGIATIIGAPYLGKLGDRIGQEKTLPMLLLLSGLFALPQVWTDHLYELYVWRFLQGLVVGGVWPALQALINAQCPRRIQGRVFGVTASSRFLGNLTGPTAAGAVAGLFSIAYMFALSGLLLIATGALVGYANRQAAAGAQSFDIKEKLAAWKHRLHSRH